MTYTLLPNEDESTLRLAFQQVRNAVESNGSKFTMGCEVMFDFDGNLRNIYMEVIGNEYKHKCPGCSFHFGQCICRYVNGEKMMPQYRDQTNSVLRYVIQAALGIPYLREEDLEHVPADLHSIFDHIKDSDPQTYNFLCNFIDNYIDGYWLKKRDRADICFWGDLSHFSSAHMSNNALESYNNEFYTILGRTAHPNPYYFMCIVRKALAINKQILTWVEEGEYEEVKSANAKKAVEKRQKLKCLYQNRLHKAETTTEIRRARIKYMIATGRVG